MGVVRRGTSDVLSVHIMEPEVVLFCLPLCWSSDLWVCMYVCMSEL